MTFSPVIDLNCVYIETSQKYDKVLIINNLNNKLINNYTNAFLLIFQIILYL